MKLDSLNTLLEEELKDVYSAEKQLLRALPKMVKNASSPELKTALAEHLKITQTQVTRLESVFAELGKPAKAKTCAAMKGLIEEATEMMEEDAEDSVMDAAIIACAQKVEHYEIATYGTLRTWATQVGENRAAKLLEQTLKEEEEADERLTGIAETGVNQDAEDGAQATKGGKKSVSRR